ncbi:MAG: hypothetical protein WA087_04005 [Candidatus Saccharimonadales bacterium]
MENQPEKTMPAEQILPEEPYAQHYADLEKSKQENEVKEEATETKPDTQKGFIGLKTAIATGLLLAATAGAGSYANKVYQDENRFPDNYRPVPTAEESSVMHASSAVEIPDAEKLAAEREQIPKPELTEPYVKAEYTATGEPIAQATQQAELDKHWENFEKVHEGHPMNVNDVSAYKNSEK